MSLNSLIYPPGLPELIMPPSQNVGEYPYSSLSWHFQMSTYIVATISLKSSQSHSCNQLGQYFIFQKTDNVIFWSSYCIFAHFIFCFFYFYFLYEFTLIPIIHYIILHLSEITLKLQHKCIFHYVWSLSIGVFFEDKKILGLYSRVILSVWVGTLVTITGHYCYYGLLFQKTHYYKLRQAFHILLSVAQKVFIQHFQSPKNNAWEEKATFSAHIVYHFGLHNHIGPNSQSNSGHCVWSSGIKKEIRLKIL